jgi:alpha-glucosidase (family GH31 glycosyl hydrolase)
LARSASALAQTVVAQTQRSRQDKRVRWASKRDAVVWIFVLSGLALDVSCKSDASASGSSDGGNNSSAACVVAEPRPLVASPPRTPKWAFEPWISKDISTRADTYDFVSGFSSRDIPIGVVVLDSPWETNYNTFIPNPTRYGDFPGLVSDMHARGVRVVLWTTSLVNSTSFDLEPGGDAYDGASPTLQQGEDCGFFVDEGQTYPWWKGKGAGLDFFDANARAWFHTQQDVVLGAGIDGWKLDFGENYIGGLSDTFSTTDGDKARQEYGEAYYRDFLAYGRTARGPDFLTMTRAWDESYGFAGRFYAKKEDSPISWMGDNRRDWFGLADALSESFVSARAGYVAVGSDIGGYLDHDDKNLTGPEIPFDTLVFARWVAVGALSPLMQLHGRANITPWTVPDHVDETIALYKYWAGLHHALVPFFYSLAEESYAGKRGSIVTPLGDANAMTTTDFRYMLGDAFLVAPLTDATGKANVAIPNDAPYADFFTGEEIAAGATAARDYSADRSHIPLFAKAGAIVPMNVDGAQLGFGPYTGALTVMTWPATTPSSFALHEDDGSIVTLTAVETTSTITVGASVQKSAIVFRIHETRAPSAVSANGQALQSRLSDAALQAADSGFFYDAAAHAIVAKVPAQSAAVQVTITRGP